MSRHESRPGTTGLAAPFARTQYWALSGADLKLSAFAFTINSTSGAER